jgi:hypothetical protein
MNAGRCCGAAKGLDVAVNLREKQMLQRGKNYFDRHSVWTLTDF